MRLWDVSSGTLLHTLQGHAAAVRHVRFSPDGQTLASLSEDGILKLWRVSDGALLHTSFGPLTEVRTANFTRDGAHVLVTYGDDTARWWPVSGGPPTRVLQGDFIAADDTLLASVTENALLIHRASDGRVIQTYEGLQEGLTRLLFTPDHQKIVYQKGDDTLAAAQLSESPSPTSVTLGDVDGNGSIDVLDVVLTLQIITQMLQPTDEQMRAADVKQDNYLNVEDAVWILQRIVGLRPPFDARLPHSDDLKDSLQPFWKHKQVWGDVLLPPPSIQSSPGGLSIKSAGRDVWLGLWEPFFLYQDAVGDFSMEVTVQSVPECSELSALGLMVAGSVPDRITDPSHIPTWGLIHATKGYGVEAKWGGRGESQTSLSPNVKDDRLKPPYRLRLDRMGQELSFFISTDMGTTWFRIGTPIHMAERGWPLPDAVSAGIVMQTHCEGTEGGGFVKDFEAGEPVVLPR